MTKKHIQAATLNEIKSGTMKRVPMLSDSTSSHSTLSKPCKQHVLLCNVSGDYYAVDDLCTHEDMSLYLGCLKGDLVQCSLHGGKFNVKTGEPAEEPAEIPLKTYPVIIKDNVILIEVD
ncbi:MAG TPA: non-heme iron oxygenase ferredoxin subunit [Thiothrix sp.]|nr:non-heme iron oxygenase ferredoxin subunit [Thiothrix sp.]